jgi:hypothetical protein
MTHLGTSFRLKPLLDLTSNALAAVMATTHG